MSKVRFGLSEVHYALKKSDGTYETPKACKGAVTLSADYEGDQNTFYADNGPYYVTSSNNGRTGSLTIARADNQMLIDLLGYEKDANGAIIEFTDTNPKSFALLYQVEGDEEATRFVMYDVTLTPPSKEANTKEDNTEPDTEEYEFTAIPLEFEWGTEKRRAVGSYIDNDESGKAAYATWFTEVHMPTKAQA